VLILPWELVVVVNVKLFPIGNISNSLSIYYKIILDGCEITIDFKLKEPAISSPVASIWQPPKI